jgi:hypothetical protein
MATGGHDGVVRGYLVLSLVASIVLTVLVNVVLWIVPGVGERVGEALKRFAERMKPPTEESNRSAVRVVFPWRVMLVASLMVTVLLNLLVWVTR